MKVQVVRLITVSCLAFMTVFCITYCLGSMQTDRDQQNTTDAADFDSNITTVAALSPASTTAAADSPSTATSQPTQPKRTASSSSPAASWFQGTRKERARFKRLTDARRAPAIKAHQWTNSPPLTEANLKNKIVVLTFWSTWCQPCLQSIDFNNNLSQHFEDRDVMLIGICNRDGSQDMADVVRSKGITYPVAIDEAGDKSVTAYEVQSLPTYFVIDRSGRLRFADINHKHIDDAVEYLLQEKN